MTQTVTMQLYQKRTCQRLRTSETKAANRMSCHLRSLVLRLALSLSDLQELGKIKGKILREWARRSTSATNQEADPWTTFKIGWRFRCQNRRKKLIVWTSYVTRALVIGTTKIDRLLQKPSAFASQCWKNPTWDKNQHQG